MKHYTITVLETVRRTYIIGPAESADKALRLYTDDGVADLIDEETTEALIQGVPVEMPDQRQSDADFYAEKELKMKTEGR